MMINKFCHNAFLILTMVVLLSCGHQVKRMEASQDKDLSGKWNDTDSRLVSEEMIKDVMSRPWKDQFTKKHQKKPIVIVGRVKNKSHEHINVSTFVNDMEKELINSGNVQFVASRNEREEIRSERKDQDLHASETTRKSMGNEKGADFMLQGTISTIIDTESRKQVRYYQIDLTLIDLENNQKVWLGQKKIKKYIERAAVRP